MTRLDPMLLLRRAMMAFGAVPNRFDLVADRDAADSEVTKVFTHISTYRIDFGCFLASSALRIMRLVRIFRLEESTNVTL